MKQSKDRVQLEGISMRPLCALMSTRVRARCQTLFFYAMVLPLVVILAVSLASCAQETAEAPVAQAEPTTEQPTATIAPPTPTMPAPTAEPPTATSAPPTPTIPAPTAEPPTATLPPPTPTMPVPDLTVTRTGADCTVEALPPIVAAGPVVVLLVNQADEPVQFDMWRADEGYSAEDLARAVDVARMSAEGGHQEISHPAYLSDPTRATASSGASTTMERSVQPGTYAIVCLRRYPEANNEWRPFASAGPIEVGE